jgi:hypothetical protein
MENEWEAAIAVLLQEVEGDTPDLHSILLRVQQTIATLRAEGLPVPEDLRQLEQSLDARFSQESDAAEAPEMPPEAGDSA